MIQKTEEMKKIIVIAIVLLGAVFAFSACDTQHKCAAYGHYAYNMSSENPDNID